jgi:hypothetical protein
MNAAPLAQRDALYAQRFDMRVRACLTWLIPPHAILILVTALYDQRLTGALAHLTMAGLAFVIVRASRDGVRTIIFSHVYWTFSFATYAYALAHGQLASTGLAAPERSALIALTSQAGLFLAFWLSPSAPPLATLDPDTAGMRRQTVAHIESVLLALGLAGMAVKLWHLLPEAYGAALMLLFQVGLAIRILRHERPLRDPVLLLSLVLLTALSVATNERADLMAALLLLVFAVIMAGDRLLTPLNLLVAYLGWRLLTVFSAIALSVRWAREAPWRLANLFADRFFSLETLHSLANPLHTHAAARLYERQAELSPFFAALPGGPADLLARLALLPQMDVVVARIDPSGVRWGDLLAILVSALPSFGQDKLLIFSDVIVWELGLRVRDSLGRPMITAEGELFAIGGYAAIALVIPACFLALFWGYRLIARLTGSRVIAILVASQLFVTGIFSTTLLSVVTQSIREPLQLALILLVLTTIAARVSTMKARAPA